MIRTPGLGHVALSGLKMDSQFRDFAVTLSDDVAVETSICIIPASAPC
jgi:hypothetical protein